MLRNCITFPGEAASSLGLIGIAFATPLMIEERFGMQLIPIPTGRHWIFTMVAGVCLAIGIAQAGAMILDWRRARLWCARAAVLASCAPLSVYVPIGFLGSAVAAVMLITINALSATRWELRAYEKARE